VGNQSKQKQSVPVFGNIFCMVIAFCYKKAHDRAGNSADGVHQKGNPGSGISGEKQPCNMVYGHGNYGNELYRIGVE
jgi:hypothetical protein